MSKRSTTPRASPDGPPAEASAPAVPGSPATFYRRGTFSRENSMGFLMRRIGAMLVSEVDKRLQGQGLTHAQWTPLFLIHQGRASTLAELSRDMQVDAGALTRTLDRLEAKGLCRRERSKEDRRVVHLSLTEEGKAAMAPVPGVLCEISNGLLSGFTHDEWQTLMDLLRRVVANGEAMRHARDEPTDAA